MFTASRRAIQSAFVLVLSVLFAACGSGSSTPTSPSPTSPASSQSVPSAPSSLSTEGVDIVQRTLSIGWPHVAGAERYVVEAGTAPGNNDVATLSITPTSGVLGRVVGTLTDVPPLAEIYVRVKAQNSAGVSSPSPDLRAEMPDMRNIIEALFLGSGPYGEFSRNPARRMTGWAPGSRVSVRVPHEVGGEQFEAVSQTIDDANGAIGDVHLFTERATLTRSQWDQLRPPGITILVGQGACVRADGSSADCSVNSPVPVYATSFILMTSPVERARTWSHELGHSVGLSHLLFRVRFDAVSINQVFSRYVPLMGTIFIETDRGTFAPGGPASNRFSELELEAIRRVYSSGLRPGSSVADFVARGLITP